MNAPRRLPRLLALAPVAALLVSLNAAPAGASAAPEAVASPYGRTDPVGETPIARMDITSIRIVHGPIIKLTIRTREPINPATSSGFDRGSFMVFPIRIDAGESIDFSPILWWNLADELVVEVYEGSSFTVSHLLCTGEYTRSDGGRAHQITFPRSCIGNPSKFRTRGMTRWFTPSFIQWTDLAPGSTNTPSITFAA